MSAGRDGAAKPLRGTSACGKPLSMKTLMCLCLCLIAVPALAAPVDDRIAEGRAALQAKDVVKAMAAFNAAVEADPANADAAYERGRVLAMIGEPKAAIIDFTAAIVARPAFGRAYAERGAAKFVIDAKEEAFADFGNAILQSPKDHEVYVLRATHWLKLGRLDDARLDIEKAASLADEKTAASLRRFAAKLK
jgi:tetratricopeptide (TPR) repeat protein